MDEIFELVARAIFEILIRGPGWVVVRTFRPAEEIDAEGCLVLLFGFIFWGIVGALIYGIVKMMS